MTSLGPDELSPAALRERVRQALGRLLGGFSPVLETIEMPGPQAVSRQDVVLAGVRLILRCLVVLCAEARGLWPARGNDDAEGRGRARFRSLPGVGSGLFAAGDKAASDPSRRALALCEAQMEALPDTVLRDVLTPLADIHVEPEHLGVLYEGLLDVEVQRRASGTWSLVPGTNTRKGTGTFYTPFALVLPTVRRTLEPLCYEAQTAATERTPRRPEEILALTVCDPAMGAGVFLIAALRVLTEALLASVRFHGRLQGFETQLAVRLKRELALRCLHGVDLDPPAVELSAVALWLETMDPALPVDTLHARLRLGNALVGGRIDRALDYPRMALAREALNDKMREHDATDRPRPADDSSVEIREALDIWCAIWFWPADAIGYRPTPLDFRNPPAETRALVAELAREHRFFHWELEFPAVFAGPAGGFAAIVGNPPWETLQPSSKEFFSHYDCAYPTYGKQEGLLRQRALFAADASIERAWQAYCGRFKALGHWYKHGAGFRHQGDGKPYSYKLFIEMACVLLRPGGRLGFLVPSGLYTDKGTTALRKFLLDRCRWEWLFGFENRRRIFAIDNRFKFNAILVCKGGRTTVLHTAFMHTSMDAWEHAERHAMPYPRARIEPLSPRSSVLLELRCERDLQVLETLYAHAVLLGEPAPRGWGLDYRQGDFNMTTDSSWFPPRPWWEARSFVPHDDGAWRDPAGAVALPLYEGRMLGAFDFSEKGWVRGKARSAVWRPIALPEGGAKPIEPQYLMSQDDFLQRGAWHGLKVGFLAIGSATNARSMVCTSLYDVPCGNAVGLLRTSPGAGVLDSLFLVAILNSFAYDFALRCRLGGINLNGFVIEETPLVPPGSLRTENQAQDRRLRARVAWLAARLAWTHPRLAPLWLAAQAEAQDSGVVTGDSGASGWAVTAHERLRLRCILDAMIAHFYGLDVDDLAWILRDCDHPVSALRAVGFQRKLDPKGFWRVDKEREPELRHPVLVQVAFATLKRLGVEAFLALHDGAGWMLPDTLRLADHGLGHDARAREAQPVAQQIRGAQPATGASSSAPQSNCAPSRPSTA